jgi:choice-of-anchor B domain-containing protein
MRFVLLVCCLIVPNIFFAQMLLQPIGHLKIDSVSMAGCWHHVDSNGTEYALVGTSRGMSIVDLSNPFAPKERFKVPGLLNNWREVKTWGGFAYVGSEAAGSGITIVDLRALPDTISWKVWKGDSAHVDQVLRSHTVQAEAGYLYIFGAYPIQNGALICDLTDPWNPKIVGQYAANYVHDGFIRGDTLWTSEIYAGQFGVIDIFDKANPELIITHPTPFAFNHNTNLSDDSKVLFTTDEKSNAPLASFDVSDLQNITLLDKYYPSFNPSKEVHNVRVLNNFLINPSYGGQLTIVDATRPNNLVETARALLGSSLVWDADPYLPSGILFATAKNEGLFIFKPTYRRASYLEGKVTDAANGLPIALANIFISAVSIVDSTDANGIYKTGTDSAGLFSVTVQCSGYKTKIIDPVSLQNGQTTLLDVELEAMPVDVSQSNKALNYQVYPTIFQASIHVVFNPNSSRVGVFQLLDGKGRIVFKKSISSSPMQCDLPKQLPAGSYVARIMDGQGMVQYQTLVIKL